MPEFLTPTTELEAVNAILASVGESPVDAIDGEFLDECRKPPRPNDGLELQ